MKTIIYLDVDGVLNAATRRSPSVKITGWDDWTIERVGRWPINHSPAMIAAINALAAREDVAFKWLTTWEDDAAQKLSPAIGVNGQEWEVLHGDQHAWGGDKGWWKLDAIQADVEASDATAFVWIDDDLSSEQPAIAWAHSREDLLAISPSMTNGLTREDLEQITDFVSIRKVAA